MLKTLIPLKNLRFKQRGLTAVEYAVAGGALMILILGAFTIFGGGLEGVLCDILESVGGQCAAG